MRLEAGQIINDGENELVICTIKKYKEDLYIYVVNPNTDEVGFYKVTEKNDSYDFELVEENSLVEKLILEFAKVISEKNPNTLKELKEIFNSQKKKEDNI